MKSVIIVSVMTFILIFGGVAFISNIIRSDPGPDPTLVAERNALEDLQVQLEAQQVAARNEHDRWRRNQSATAVQALVLEEGTARLLALVSEMETADTERHDQREASVDHLAKVYENMKPAQAAPIIAALEFQTILEVMGRMHERHAARILASMEPTTAAAISAGLSQGGRG